jgi:hypothetical protein
MLHLTKSKEKKTLPVAGRGDIEGCKILRIPHCLDNRLIDVGKVVSPTITILDIFHRPSFVQNSTEPNRFVRTSQEAWVLGLRYELSIGL